MIEKIKLTYLETQEAEFIDKIFNTSFSGKKITDIDYFRIEGQTFTFSYFADDYEGLLFNFNYNHIEVAKILFARIKFELIDDRNLTIGTYFLKLENNIKFDRKTKVYTITLMDSVSLIALISQNIDTAVIRDNEASINIELGKIQIPRQGDFSVLKNIMEIITSQFEIDIQSMPESLPINYTNLEIDLQIPHEDLTFSRNIDSTAKVGFLFYDSAQSVTSTVGITVLKFVSFLRRGFKTLPNGSQQEDYRRYTKYQIYFFRQGGYYPPYFFYNGWLTSDKNFLGETLDTSDFSVMNNSVIYLNVLYDLRTRYDESGNSDGIAPPIFEWDENDAIGVINTFLSGQEITTNLPYTFEQNVQNLPAGITFYNVQGYTRLGNTTSSVDWEGNIIEAPITEKNTRIKLTLSGFRIFEKYSILNQGHDDSGQPIYPKFTLNGFISTILNLSNLFFKTNQNGSIVFESRPSFPLTLISDISSDVWDVKDEYSFLRLKDYTIEGITDQTGRIKEILDLFYNQNRQYFRKKLTCKMYVDLDFEYFGKSFLIDDWKSSLISIKIFTKTIQNGKAIAELEFIGGE